MNKITGTCKSIVDGRPDGPWGAPAGRLVAEGVAARAGDMSGDWWGVSPLLAGTGPARLLPSVWWGMSPALIHNTTLGSPHKGPYRLRVILTYKPRAVQQGVCKITTRICGSIRALLQRAQSWVRTAYIP